MTGVAGVRERWFEGACGEDCVGSPVAEIKKGVLEADAADWADARSTTEPGVEPRLNTIDTPTTGPASLIERMPRRTLRDPRSKCDHRSAVLVFRMMFSIGGL
jgi:hypothetical protein